MPRVLIIDANDYHAQLLSMQLTALGYKVTIENKGHKGVSSAIKNPPDLILMESFMPDQTGFQMCNQLRRNPPTQAVPIVMMSGIAHFPNQQAFALERGATAYISKPLVTIEVGEIVDRYISWKPDSTPATATPDTNVPTSREQYTLSTDIHSAFSQRLKDVLEEKKRTA